MKTYVLHKLHIAIYLVLVWTLSYVDPIIFNGDATTQRQLVTYLMQCGFIRTSKIETVMNKVDRFNYVKTQPYIDAPKRVGYNANISAAHLHATALENLKDYLVPGAKVLDVGCGTGYFTACLALMIGEGGLVVGIDHIPELIARAKKNLQADQPELMSQNRIRLAVGDGRLGDPEDAPFDAIHVGGTLPELSKVLLSQLKPGGRMFQPIKTAEVYQTVIMLVDKDMDGNTHIETVASSHIPELMDKRTQLAIPEDGYDPWAMQIDPRIKQKYPAKEAGRMYRPPEEDSLSEVTESTSIDPWDLVPEKEIAKMEKGINMKNQNFSFAAASNEYRNEEED